MEKDATKCANVLNAHIHHRHDALSLKTVALPGQTSGSRQKEHGVYMYTYIYIRVHIHIYIINEYRYTYMYIYRRKYMCIPGRRTSTNLFALVVCIAKGCVEIRYCCTRWRWIRPAQRRAGCPIFAAATKGSSH